MAQQPLPPAARTRSRRVVQPRRRPARAAAAAAAPRHRAAGRPRRPGAALPDGADRAGGVAASAGSRSPSRCARSTRCGGRRRSTAPTGWSGRSGTDLPHLLQVRGRSARPAPTSRTPPCPGLLQRAGGRHAARDRDGRRPVGLGAGVRLPPVRPRGQGLHGARLVRQQAVPARADRDLGRRSASPAPRRTPTPAGAILAADPDSPARSASPSPRRSRTPRPARTPSTRSARCSTTCCSTRP